MNWFWFRRRLCRKVFVNRFNCGVNCLLLFFDLNEYCCLMQNKRIYCDTLSPGLYKVTVFGIHNGKLILSAIFGFNFVFITIAKLVLSNSKEKKKKRKKTKCATQMHFSSDLLIFVSWKVDDLILLTVKYTWFIVSRWNEFPKTLLSRTVIRRYWLWYLG